MTLFEASLLTERFFSQAIKDQKLTNDELIKIAKLTSQIAEDAITRIGSLSSLYDNKKQLKLEKVEQ